LFTACSDTADYLEKKMDTYQLICNKVTTLKKNH